MLCYLRTAPQVADSGANAPSQLPHPGKNVCKSGHVSVDAAAVGRVHSAAESLLAALQGAINSHGSLRGAEASLQNGALEEANPNVSAQAGPGLIAQVGVASRTADIFTE